MRAKKQEFAKRGIKGATCKGLKASKCPDVNIPFPLYGSIGHGDAYELLAPSTGERPIDYLNEFLIPNIQL